MTQIIQRATSSDDAVVIWYSENIVNDNGVDSSINNYTPVTPEAQNAQRAKMRASNFIMITLLLTLCQTDQLRLQMNITTIITYSS